MFVTLLRVLLGFVVACLVAGAIKVGFVMTPMEIAALPSATMTDRLAEAGMLALATATQSAVFAAPFALVAAAIAEWQAVRGFLYYAIIGLAISAGGFVALYAGEATGQPTIVNPYASTAFAVAGLVGGLVYWLLAGRYAGEVQPADDLPPLGRDAGPAKVNRPAAAVPPMRTTPAAPPPSAGTPPRKA